MICVFKSFLKDNIYSNTVTKSEKVIFKFK